MKKSIDIRKRVGTLIASIKEVPAKRRSAALEQLLTDLQRACAEYDAEPQAGAE
ncbi:MAG TPA: hypothetical protein VNM70_10790 [Burkholderiales bacterium]|nr:hypothetical protein [Burkholderiales bacterium]